MSAKLKPAQLDVRVSDHGTLVLFRPLTDEARRWLHEHVQADAQWFGGALVCERRYAGDLAEGLRENGGFQVGG